LSCFFVERGSGVEFQRLKDKLGYRSLPSTEMELHGAPGRLVGEEGRGVREVMRTVSHARFDCLTSSAGTIRRGVVEAIHHARHRSAFGRALAEQPAMTNVLADLVIESEAATAAAMRVAASYDADEPQFRRLATAVCKYHVCKRASAHAAEALECLGGNGFVEDSGLPRLYRDAPLPGVWEGSGNVAALDVIRVADREPDALDALLTECEAAAGADKRLDAHLAALRPRLGSVSESDARRIVEDLGFALQASLLVRYAPACVADAFCAARLGGEAGRAYGTLPAATDLNAIVDRAFPG
jgi:putative acyl-CoA dehydrogenase